MNKILTPFENALICFGVFAMGLYFAAAFFVPEWVAIINPNTIALPIFAGGCVFAILMAGVDALLSKKQAKKDTLLKQDSE